jgi:cysteine desulfurase family protein
MIYLDNAATSFPKPESVYTAVDTFSRTLAGNPGRGGHRFAVASERTIHEARRALARLLGVSDPVRVVFTFNATDALNLAIKGWLRPGDHVVTTDLEHNSVSRPLAALAARGTISLDRLRSDDRGLIDPLDVRRALTPASRLVAVCHASNVLGSVQDLAAIAEEAHRVGAALLVDASQSAGVIPIDVEGMGVDLLAFTGHKALLGPMGTGGLALNRGVEPAPWREGGTGGDSSSPTQPLELPHRLEGGTPNAMGLAGLAAGVHFVEERGLANIAAHERALAARLAEKISQGGRVRILAAPEGTPLARGTRASEGPGPVLAQTGLVAFTIDGYRPQEAAAVLDESFGIALRSGLHCAPYIHQRWGLAPDGTLRATPGPFTTEEEIDRAAEAILAIAGS